MDAGADPKIELQRGAGPSRDRQPAEERRGDRRENDAAIRLRCPMPMRFALGTMTARARGRQR